MKFPSIQFVNFALSLLITALFINSCKGAGFFYNPILDIENTDHYIYLHTNGYYYMTRGDGSDLYLYKSKSLSDWRLAERKLIHTKNGTGTTHHQSEIHFLSGNWYIYFDSMVPVGSLLFRHLFVIRALNPDNPFSGYSEEIRLTPAPATPPQEDFDQIHGTILELKQNGSLYIIYACRGTNNTGPWEIFIAPLSNPTTISGPHVLIRDTMTTWDAEVISPQILHENRNENRTFLVFTGRSEEVDCLGLMGIDDGKDPLVAANWWHYPNGTVFASNSAANAWNPGYVSFTYSPDLTESWMAYKAVSSVNETDWTSRLGKIEWNEDGTPMFATPTALTTPLPLPSGEIS